MAHKRFSSKNLKILHGFSDYSDVKVVPLTSLKSSETNS